MTKYRAKLVDVAKGEYYFGVKCPTTGKVLAIDEDPSRGRATYALANVFVSCHLCQSAHLLPGSAVFSFQADGTE